MEDNIEKKVDESWKDTVEKEKEKVSEHPQHQARHKAKEKPGKESHFSLFISSLGMQGLIFLGLVPNPATREKEVDLDHAKYIIDTLEMLKEKTQNNLSAEEKEFLEGTLYELRMHFVERNK
jgi:hypothetical protein